MVRRTRNKITESISFSSPEDQDSWIRTKWRPAAAWSYIATCTFDFILFPIAWSVLQAVMKQDVTQWNPITLQGAGLYHLAMGAVLGVTAWSRGQEKIATFGKSFPINSTNTLPNTDLEDADNTTRNGRQ